MVEETTPTRRRLLRAGAITAMVTLTGCTVDIEGYEIGVGEDERDDTGTPNQKTSASTPAPTATLTPTPTVTPTTTTATATPTPNETANGSVPDVRVQTPVIADYSPDPDESLEAPDAEEFSGGFGSSVAVSDDGSTAVVGAPRDGDTDGPRAGSVYVFVASDDGWAYRTKLTPSNDSETYRFGQSVAVSSGGTTVIVGSYGEGETTFAHVFELRDFANVERGPFEGHEESFIAPVAVSGDGRTAILGNPRVSEKNPVYVLEALDGTWDYGERLEPVRNREWSAYGQSVALSADGETAIVGEPPYVSNAESHVGRAHAFVRSDDTWRRAVLQADDGEPGDRFGEAVAVSDDGTTVIIGAPGDQHPNIPGAGAVYVYERADGRWRQADKYRPHGYEGSDVDFGSSVSVSSDGSIAVICAPASNSAYVLEQSDSGWSKAVQLLSVERQISYDASVAVGDNGTTAVISDRGIGGPNGSRTGRAWVFTDFV